LFLVTKWQIALFLSLRNGFVTKKTLCHTIVRDNNLLSHNMTTYKTARDKPQESDISIKDAGWEIVQKKWESLHAKGRMSTWKLSYRRHGICSSFRYLTFYILRRSACNPSIRSNLFLAHHGYAPVSRSKPIYSVESATEKSQLNLSYSEIINGIHGKSKNERMTELRMRLTCLLAERCHTTWPSQ